MSRVWVAGLVLAGMPAVGSCSTEKLGGSWVLKTQWTGAVESGNTITKLERVSGLRRTQVASNIGLARYYGDDCVVFDTSIRPGERRTFAMCGDRLPVLVGNVGGFFPEGIGREVRILVRDDAPWREREIVPIEEIKRRAMAAEPFRASWRQDLASVEEMAVTTTASRLAMEEKLDYTGRTPLMELVIQQELAPVEALIRGGADVNAKDKYGVTALILAINPDQPQEGIVRALLEAGANINVAETASGETPLLFAIGNRHTKIATLFIEAGADVNARTSRGDTPLSLARRLELEPVVAALQTAGAK